MAGIREILRAADENPYVPSKQPYVEPPPIVNDIYEVKFHLRRMPYGDFVEMANAIRADCESMWLWAHE